MNEKEHQTEEDIAPRSFMGVIVHSFFIIPFLIAVFCVLLFTAVSLLTHEDKSAQEYLEDIQVGGITKRWQSAFELSKLLANPDFVPKDIRFQGKMIAAFQASDRDDLRVRQYLALAMARTGNPAYYDVLAQGLRQAEDDSAYAFLYALGMLKDARAVSSIKPYLTHDNARLRSVAVAALGTIGDRSAQEYLKKALSDSEPNVQWAAAISLTRMGDDSGADILIRLLDRAYLDSFPEVDPVEQTQIMLEVIRAARKIDNPQINAQIVKVAESDKNMKVRAAALDYRDANVN